MSAVVYEYPLDSDYIVVRTISYATVRGNLTQAGPEGIDVKRVGVTFASNIGYDDYGGAIYAKNANVTPVLAGNVYLKTTVV
jgi:predicted outer membrane repeat protein